MTNDELNPDGEIRNNANIILALRHLSFDIPLSFVIRHSSFPTLARQICWWQGFQPQ
jgi:hypothetical protein